MSITQDDVKRLFGDIRDHMIVEILASGATETELQEAAAHLAQETDVMGELERPLIGRALRIYEMIKRVEEEWDEDR